MSRSTYKVDRYMKHNYRINSLHLNSQGSHFHDKLYFTIITINFLYVILRVCLHLHCLVSELKTIIFTKCIDSYMFAMAYEIRNFLLFKQGIKILFKKNEMKISDLLPASVLYAKYTETQMQLHSAVIVCVHIQIKYTLSVKCYIDNDKL